MTSSLFGTPTRVFLLVGLSAVGIALTLRADRSSEARANRLHRGGQLDDAAQIYRDHLEEDSTRTRLRYNLGTTMLRLGSPAAYTQLATGSETGSERLRVRAYYNMGLSSLIQALFAESNDSILANAARSVEANKNALRLDPDQLDARWNLALAQRILVNATPEQGPGNMDSPSGGPEIGELQLVNEPPPQQQEEDVGDTPSEGEEESLAEEDLEPLSLAEAGDILGIGHRDPSTILGKLLLREGRSRRQRGMPSVTGPPW